jgi:hypothetical protein
LIFSNSICLEWKKGFWFFVFGQIPDIVFGLTREKVVQNSNLQGVTNASGLKLVVHSDYPKR